MDGSTNGVQDFMTEKLSLPPEGYVEWLKDVKKKNRSVQQKAVLAANNEMLILYWQLGRDELSED